MVISKTLNPFDACERAREVASVVLPTPPVPQNISNDLVIMATAYSI